MSAEAPRMSALVLAGDRSANDPLLKQAGKPCKAVIEFAGRPMVLRVLDALEAASTVDQVILSGPAEAHLQGQQELQERIGAGQPNWVPPRASPSASTYAVLSALPPEQPVLVTTADHPLLSATVVDDFCSRSLALDVDVVVGLAPYELVREAFPELKKTVLRFRDGNYCGCNLFVFATQQGRVVADRWREVEAERKNPRKVISMLGISSLLAYRAGLLTLDGALARLSKRMGVRLGVVRLPYAEAAVDVDSAADHAVLERSQKS